MSLLLETIKCEDGKLHHLEWHNARFNAAQKEYFGSSVRSNLAKIIRIPDYAQTGLFRCRITYSSNIEKIEFLPHQFRKVERLKLVEDNSIDYRFKYADRTHLQKLFEQRNACDDILIIKNGHITDSFTANPVFFDGAEWWTPDTPLLPGTQRARLLHEGSIKTSSITPGDLSKYIAVSLINAMQELETLPPISIQNIIR